MVNKRNTELQWKPLPASIVLPTHLEHIFTVSIALRTYKHTHKHTYSEKNEEVLFYFLMKKIYEQAQLRSAMETVKICSKCVGSTINAGSGFHGSSVLRLFK